MNARKHRLQIVTDAVHFVLKPLGFKNKKLDWRRTMGETLQQFSIDNMQRATAWYRPEWGLNIVSRNGEAEPKACRLQVQWMMERLVGDIDERLRYLSCFKTDREIPDDERASLVREMLSHYVVPCFEMYTTEASIKKMMCERDHPFRAAAFVDLPDEWSPEGYNPGKLAGPFRPPIIRPWRGRGE